MFFKAPGHYDVDKVKLGNGPAYSFGIKVISERPGMQNFIFFIFFSLKF
jgi:hypothetical protein